ncbi:mating type 1-1-2 [Fusarium beomiforme]|uniref:Mating type 1-1-2 n=1 Tax=Fusarium beomiforme TaxID=44412 RepID=A0A9P5DP48_9HYPO|nr:mating type 1-1-2 [Fusarium beomiforme]
MDSAFSFSPLWEDRAIIYKPEKALDTLHAKVISIILRKVDLPEEGAAFSPQDILDSAFFAINQVLTDLSINNEVLNKIRATHIRLSGFGSPVKVIDAALMRWYTGAVIVLHTHHSARSRIGPPGFNVRWARGYRNLHPFANLGFMTMLRGFETWAHPKHPKLQAASLISKTAIAIMYATYTIGPHIKNFALHHLDSMPVAKSRELFLKLFVSVSGNVYNDDEVFATPPAFEFGAARGNVRISQQGKKLLVKTRTDQTYRCAPYWHPYRRVPGSPWNNYIKNSEVSTFSNDSSLAHSKIKYTLPLNAMFLAGHMRQKYVITRIYVHAMRPNYLPTLSDEERLSQLKWLAHHSGRPYADDSPHEADADEVFDIGDEYLFHTPVVQKPRADLSGHLTLPFMSTAVHAIQRRHDPTETNQFLILGFKQDRSEVKA